MNKALNLSIVEGRVVRDPEVYYTKNGHAMCKIDLAVNESYQFGGKAIRDVTFVSVNVWNKLAEASAKYLKKGSSVRVRGRLKQSTWEDKTGKKNYKLFVDAQVVDFLGYPKATPSQEASRQVERVPF